MTNPLKVTRSQLKRLQRNLSVPTPNLSRLKERAKGELLTPFMKQYMAATGITVLTTDIIHSPEYLKALRAYWDLFVPKIVEREQGKNGTKLNTPLQQ